jgi:hypothetical protein
MAYSLDTALPIGQTGLTLSAQLYNSDGTTNGSAVTTGFVERPTGSGNYFWTYAAFPDAFRGGVAITAAGVFKMSFSINPQEAENVDTKTSSRATPADVTNALAGGGPPAVTVVTPVLSGGNMQIVRGDDYANADGRALTFNISDPTGSGLPSLTGATVRLKTGLPNRPNLPNLNVIGTVVTATGTTRTVRFELTSAQTAVLVPIAYYFDVEATLSTGRVITLLQGQCIVLADA